MTAFEEITTRIVEWRKENGKLPRSVTISTSLLSSLEAGVNFVARPSAGKSDYYVPLLTMDRIVCVPTQTERVLCHGE